MDKRDPIDSQIGCWISIIYLFYAFAVTGSLGFQRSDLPPSMVPLVGLSGVLSPFLALAYAIVRRRAHARTPQRPESDTEPAAGDLAEESETAARDDAMTLFPAPPNALFELAREIDSARTPGWFARVNAVVRAHQTASAAALLLVAPLIGALAWWITDIIGSQGAR